MAEVNPRAIPTYLDPEIEDDTLERESLAREKQAEVARIRDVEALLASPLWAHVTAQATERLGRALDALVEGTPVHDPQADAMARAKAQEMRWLLGLPEELARLRATLSSEIAELEASPDEEGSDDA